MTTVTERDESATPESLTEPDLRYVVCRACGYEKVLGDQCGLPCV